MKIAFFAIIFVMGIFARAEEGEVIASPNEEAISQVTTSSGEGFEQCIANDGVDEPQHFRRISETRDAVVYEARVGSASVRIVHNFGNEITRYKSIIGLRWHGDALFYMEGVNLADDREVSSGSGWSISRAVWKPDGRVNESEFLEHFMDKDSGQLGPSIGVNKRIYVSCAPMF